MQSSPARGQCSERMGAVVMQASEETCRGVALQQVGLLVVDVTSMVVLRDGKTSVVCCNGCCSCCGLPSGEASPLCVASPSNNVALVRGVVPLLFEASVVLLATVFVMRMSAVESLDKTLARPDAEEEDSLLLLVLRLLPAQHYASAC